MLKNSFCVLLFIQGYQICLVDGSNALSFVSITMTDIHTPREHPAVGFVQIAFALMIVMILTAIILVTAFYTGLLTACWLAEGGTSVYNMLIDKRLIFG